MKQISYSSIMVESFTVFLLKLSVTKERVTKNYNVRGFCNVSEVTAVCAFYT